MTALASCKICAEQNVKEEWLNEWSAGKTGRSMYAYMSKPNPKDNINLLERKDQVNIFRLRTGHAALNAHLNRIKPSIPPNCVLCNAPSETTEHFLFKCQVLKHLRERFLPPSPDPGNTLYSTLQQLRNTCKYVIMAGSLRARAQQTAGSE